MTRAAAHPFELVLGLIVWSAWFVALYGGLSLACTHVPPDPRAGAATWLNALLAAFTLVTATWLAWRAYACWRLAADGARRGFVATLSAGVYVAAAVATLVIGVPVILLAPCT